MRAVDVMASLLLQSGKDIAPLKKKKDFSMIGYDGMQKLKY